jgi:hypothetical protein
MPLTSLRRVLQNPKALIILYLQELAVFLSLFALLAVYLDSIAGGSYYAWSPDLSFLVKAADNPGAMGMLGVVLIAAGILFFALRLLLMGGVFETLAYGWDDLPAFFQGARRHVLRFLLLALIFLSAAGIAWGVAGAVFGKIGGSIADTRWPFCALFVKGAVAWLLLTPIAFLHASSRFRTLRRRAFSITFRISWKALAAFYGYALADPLLALLLFAMIPAVLKGRSGFGALAWIIVFQLVLLLKLVFRLSAFACAERGPESDRP